MSGGFTKADQLETRQRRGKMVRTLYDFKHPQACEQTWLRAFISGRPGEPNFIAPKDFERDVHFLVERGYLRFVEVEDPTELHKVLQFVQLTDKGVDLYEANIPADPSVEIPR